MRAEIREVEDILVARKRMTEEKEEQKKSLKPVSVEYNRKEIYRVTFSCVDVPCSSINNVDAPRDGDPKGKGSGNIYIL